MEQYVPTAGTFLPLAFAFAAVVVAAEHLAVCGYSFATFYPWGDVVSFHVR